MTPKAWRGWLLIVIAIVQVVAFEADSPAAIIAVWLGLFFWGLFALFNYLAWRNKHWPKS